MQGIELFDLARDYPESRGFSGVVCDGRYIYYVPLNNGNLHGQVARFDTARAFGDPAAWERFDTAQVHAGSRGFIDGLFDGRYLYLVPFCRGQHHGQVTRYDTQGDFSDPASWSVFDTGTVHPNSKGFVSGCFDGRHIYFAPYQSDFTTTHGQVTRYDTQGTFADPASWQVFDTMGANANSRGFHSAVAYGDYVYFIPYLRGGKEYSGLLARYDKRLPFDASSSWQFTDLTALDKGCRGFVGATCVDDMIYFAPYMDGEDRHGRVVRYDTRGELHDAAAWTMFDVSQVDKGSRGFFGALSDGKHLYLIPHCRGVGQYHGQMTRLDLSKPFGDAASWSICDLGKVDPACRGFIGGVIKDGWLYLAPFETDAGAHSGLAARISLAEQDIWSKTI